MKYESYAFGILRRLVSVWFLLSVILCIPAVSFGNIVFIVALAAVAGIYLVRTVLVAVDAFKHRGQHARFTVTYGWELADDIVFLIALLLYLTFNMDDVVSIILACIGIIVAVGAIVLTIYTEHTERVSEKDKAWDYLVANFPNVDLKRKTEMFLGWMVCYNVSAEEMFDKLDYPCMADLKDKVLKDGQVGLSIKMSVRDPEPDKPVEDKDPE